MHEPEGSHDLKSMNPRSEPLALLFKNAQSSAMKELLAKIQRCAQVHLPVLLRGETGTGKDIVAQAIHQARAPKAPLVTLNCGAIARRLAQSELFGHKRGSFTGATQDHHGVFERAGQGCVFLDEIGELSLDLQPQLLRVLETGFFLPVGGDKELRNRADLIAATHRPLGRWVQEQSFREDLYHRLNILSIELPALRERREDIPGLMAHFSQLAQAQLDTKIEIKPCALAWAKDQPWPGNLRELRNLILRSAVLLGSVLTGASLRKAQEGPSELGPQPSELTILRAGFYEMKDQLLQDAMARHQSLSKAALALGIPKSTLAGWLRKSPPTSKAG